MKDTRPHGKNYSNPRPLIPSSEISDYSAEFGEEFLKYKNSELSLTMFLLAPKNIDICYNQIQYSKNYLLIKSNTILYLYPFFNLFLYENVNLENKTIYWYDYS